MVDADCKIHKLARVLFPELVNIYGTTIGALSRIGPFVELQRGTVIGKNTLVQRYACTVEGTIIGDRCFIGPGVILVNDVYPTTDGAVQLGAPQVADDASIGAGSIVFPVHIGEGAIVGAGSLVLADVPAWSIAHGRPARVHRQLAGKAERAAYIAQRHSS